MQDRKPEQTPQRFVQKARVYSDVRAVDDGVFAYHSPRQVGLRSKRLLVGKIAPSADSLAEQKAHHGYVEHRQKLHLLQLCNKQSAAQCADYSAVDCQSAVVDVQYLDRVASVIIPLEQAKIQPCPNDTANQPGEYTIEKLVKIHLVTLRASPCIEHGKQKPCHDYKSVPVNLEISELKGDPVYIKFKPQPRKADMKLLHITPLFRCSLQQTACSC